jgi:hypothetical protein
MYGIMTVSLLNDTAMSIFFLTLRLRVRYFIYSLFNFVAYPIIGSALEEKTSSNFLSITFYYLSISQWIAGAVALYLQVIGVRTAMEFYTRNKVGKNRAGRGLIKHRDVMSIDTSWQTQWKSTKRYSLFCEVIPANLIGIILLLGLPALIVQRIGFVPLFGIIALGLLCVFSQSYAEDHLCDPEVNELYKNPQSYDYALTAIKQERREQIAMEQAKQRLEQERKRNSPVPPQSEKQKQPPHKPY